jgi:hypothetical protein
MDGWQINSKLWQSNRSTWAHPEPYKQSQAESGPSQGFLLLLRKCFGTLQQVIKHCKCRLLVKCKRFGSGLPRLSKLLPLICNSTTESIWLPLCLAPFYKHRNNLTDWLMNSQSITLVKFQVPRWTSWWMRLPTVWALSWGITTCFLLHSDLEHHPLSGPLGLLARGRVVVMGLGQTTTWGLLLCNI